MFNKVLTKVFGSQHERDVKKLQPLVDAINAKEAEIKTLSDDQLKAKTEEFRAQIAAGEKLDDLLVPAFAVAREAGWRTVGMRAYDVQLLGGIVLHKGRIAEMKTGEGKTLMATLPVYLNALAGQGVHVVTVNDYLARRDAAWMGQIYQFMGLTVGTVQHDMPDADRKAAYGSDVTYGTNNEFGFDYLRDNMKFDVETMVQRGHHYSIVDEVDSILVDEARTPLIISGPSEESVDRYYTIDRIIPQFEQGEEIEEEDGSKYATGDFLVDEKAHTVTLTDAGVSKAEKLLGVSNLYDLDNISLLHGVNQGLRAHNMYKRDVDYLLKDGQVVIVDEFTGRMMAGRRWSDGLHQAVEAKEGVKIERENQTLATITFQNYFRMYDKLSGMTGTAETEATEFGEIYKLEVSVIPTNRPMIRDDRADLVFRTAREKWNAVADEIKECQQNGQPVLVGTISIETSEMLSSGLKKRGVQHVVLNAKHHERESHIVAMAGRKGAVTIATNMAGRGTDILLGGNPELLARGEADPDNPEEAEAYQAALTRYEELCKQERDEVLTSGGLHILGTERHESRRIDNQLRGRAGRQGDAGSSRFFLSLEDDLMRIFGTDRVQSLLGRLGMEEGEAIEHKMVTRAIERAQKQVEGRNFEIRKNLLEYDDVMNKQREAIYALRDDILHKSQTRNYLSKVTEDIVNYIVETHCPEKSDPEDWDLTEISTDMLAYFNIPVGDLGIDLNELGVEEMREGLLAESRARYEAKEQKHGPEMMRAFEKNLMLQRVDRAWKDHLLALDHLKEGIGLRGYAQRDPKNEYKRESFELFQEMKERVENSIVKTAYRFEPMTEEQLMELRQRRTAQAARPNFQFAAPPKQSAPPKPKTVARQMPKVGRNEPCPCGSGKKYKKCHGAKSAVS